METERERPVKMSGEIAKLAAALSKAQGEFQSIHAERTGQLGHRKYRYADLASFLTAVRGVLSKHGLAVIQRPLASDGELVWLETMITHESGEWIGGELCIKAANTTAQAIGSALTYARRYSLSSMLGLATEEDDDGKAAGTPAGPQGKAKPKTRIDVSTPACDELDRNRIIKASMDLEWSPVKLAEVLADQKGKGTRLIDLTKEEATSLAKALEKKFLSQQGKQTF